mmetsp:Transcript_85545/g.265993  ORF Transcript_85545/g.265993 Transcript_85545/m.265993 type:complete len:352 (-) Transcript_85545:105-1160(-)|eukprot:CAMPEP_0204581594 /NCGR_PEP_ID=MMETSP0661-20131031/44739_1 /ASSEMBLY_ACC=CAM_ASM_000606 /TAXON_ID=109239 /ORGANISM="Alexandrium margalefi, Strain AMGDE01CS-322" /LENGTH=351 /DNA_ID=CAMNT_0051590805 /DNA_START=64 /DNA_END=1119 /DNA_ORIENTATION=-
MARSTKLFLAVQAATAFTAMGLRSRPGTCDEDEVSFARITTETCGINWVLNGQRPYSTIEGISRQGCWEMKAYNTDNFLSSTVWQNSQDGRCALSFSGYHGKLVGYLRGMAALVWPPQVWNVCGHKMFAPYVRLLRHHLALGNWSKMVNTIAGPDTTCKGELTFVAESMGGSAGEMLAACADAGRLDELADGKLPSFKFQTLYTFGSPASALQPLSNSQRKDGCFKGKRIFFAEDPIAHIGALFHLQHPRMDAIEIWPGTSTSNPSVKVYPCSAPAATEDAKHEQPPAVATGLEATKETDQFQHEISTYGATIKWMQEAGEGGIFEADPMEDRPPYSLAAKYLAFLQAGTQ